MKSREKQAQLMERLNKTIREDEGRRNYVYDDATGKRINTPSEATGNPTIGEGYKLRVGDEWMYANGIDDYKVDELKKATIEENLNLAKNIINQGNPKVKFQDMPVEAQEAIVNIVFNVGSGEFGTWKNTIRYLREGNYLEASKEILRGRTPDVPSKYASGVTANRAKRVSALMASAQ